MGDALELLRFVALSLTTHADALECLTQDTHTALTQINLDEEELEILEDKLNKLQKEQERLHEMRIMVQGSRAARRGGKLISANSRGVHRENIISTKSLGKGEKMQSKGSGGAAFSNNFENILRFASNAMEVEEEEKEKEKEKEKERRILTRRDRIRKKNMILLSKNKNELENYINEDEDEDDDDEEKFSENDKEVNIDAEVERVKREIYNKERMSIKFKLRELESLKEQVKNIDIDKLAHNYVGSFQFSNEVEKLWNCENVLNSSNIDIFINQACQRISGRYNDALNTIYEFPINEKSDATRVYGSLLYTEALTSPYNYDAKYVQELQNLEKNSLLLYYKEKKRVARVSTKVTHRYIDTVLGSEEFNFLPEDWWSSQILSSSSDIYLPPARHILTSRFSFADTAELKLLQSLRIEFQREVLEAFIQMPKLLEEIRYLFKVSSNKEEDEDEKLNEEEERDACVSLVRLLESEKNSGNGIWTTIAHCVSDS